MPDPRKLFGININKSGTSSMSLKTSDTSDYKIFQSQIYYICGMLLY